MEEGNRPFKNVFSRVFHRKNTEQENEFEEEIKDMIEEGHEQGAILTQEAEMFKKIFEFGDKEAKDVMTFRQKIEAVEVSTALEDAVKFMLEEGYSRYPLYEEDIDNIVGVLHLKDAMKFYVKGNEVPLIQIAREPFYVHETQNINILFKDMQTKKIHMAIVVDEYGQTEGIVAMEDILEVIVGEILDEYDEEEQDITKLVEKDSYLVQGLTRLDEVEGILEIKFPDEDFETLNGFLLYKLGRLPNPHEEIEIVYEGYSFRVLEVQDKMIKQIKVSRVKAESS